MQRWDALQVAQYHLAADRFERDFPDAPRPVRLAPLSASWLLDLTEVELARREAERAAAEQARSRAAAGF